MRITTYTISTCSPCKKLKQWFSDKGIEFIEKDILKNESFAKEFVDKGFKYTPHTILETNNEKIEIVGLNISKIEKVFLQNSSLNGS